MILNDVHVGNLESQHPESFRRRRLISIGASDRPLPPPNATPSLNSQNAGPNITLPIRIKPLTVPSRTGQTPEIQHIGEDTAFEDVALALLVLNLLPGASFAEISVELEKFAPEEDAGVLAAQLRGHFEERWFRHPIYEGL